MLASHALRTLALRSALPLLSLFVFAGCAAAYQPPPLSTQHPAHPEALATPSMARSTTLAYRPAALPTQSPAMQMAQSGMPGSHDRHGSPGTRSHGQHGMPSAPPQGQNLVVGEGKVVAVVPSTNQVVLDHQAIPGFMDAMTMGYQVSPPSLTEGIQPGDAVRFTLDTQKKAIVTIEKMP